MPVNPESAAQDRRGLGALMLGGVALGGLMAVLTVGGIRPGLFRGARAPTPIPDPVAVGMPAPDFTAQTPAGEEIRLGSLRG